MLHEVDSWPYNFAQSKDFPTADQRGTVVGQMVVRDRYVSRLLPTCMIFPLMLDDGFT